MSDADRFPFRESATETEGDQPGRNSTGRWMRRYSQLYPVIIGSVNFKFTELHISDFGCPMD